MARVLLFLLCVFTVWNCNRSTYTYDQLPPQLVRFGTGGGFSGEVRTYTLLENGQLFLESSLRSGTADELSPLKRKRAGQLFEAAGKAACTEVLLPANRYAFLYRFSPSDTCRWMWPADQQAPDPAVEAAYRQLRKAVP
jgi:hypothetical protein